MTQGRTARECLVRLERFEHKSLGYDSAAHLAGLSPARVCIDLRGLGLAEGIAAIPAIDGLARLFPEAGLSVVGGDPCAALVAAHLGVAAGADTLPPHALEVVFELGAWPPPGVNNQTVVVRPDPGRGPRDPHAWFLGALASGFPCADVAPALRVSSGEGRRGRRWLRQTLGVLGGTAIAIFPGGHAHVAEELGKAMARLHDRVGSTAVQFGGAPVANAENVRESSWGENLPSWLAGALPGFGLCISEDLGWAAVASAVGVPCLVMHPAASANAPRERLGLQMVGGCAQTTAAFARMREVYRFSHDLSWRNVTTVGEQLAALRWPRDRVYRALP